MKKPFGIARFAWALLSHRLPRSAIVAASLAATGAASHAATPPAFIAFESGHVRPLAMSPDGSKLFAVNTPNNTLEIFNVTSSGLQFQARIVVGMEPVAVATRGNDEVWVVNHLSDSVSVVSLQGTPRVVRTLLVGDEPRDIVFAGSPLKAFVTTAHRGQQRMEPSIAHVPGAGDPQLLKPGIGRADVWVFNTDSLGNALGGVPAKIMSFFADTPRALAVSPDRNTVYVAAFKSGNQTASVSEGVICDGWDTQKSCVIGGKTFPGGALGPKTNVEGKPAPKNGMIVKWNAASGHWEDILGRNWDDALQFTLPDKDVFAVDANQLTEKLAYRQVGTTLYNMAVNPISGALYVSNTDANNFKGRFEGPGKFGGSTVQGNIAQARLTVISGATVAARSLNKHIDYAKLAGDPAFDASAKNHSLALPMDMAVSKDGRTLYVTAFGSSKVGVYDTADIERDSFDPRVASARHIEVTGGGPSGVALDEARGRLYVMTRFDNAVKVINLSSGQEAGKAMLPNPEPANIVAGRPFLYDAQRSSANGEASCASCHVFGDDDALAWDLGNPDDKVTVSPIPGEFTAPLIFAGAKLIFKVKNKINGSDNPKHFHPMKGPMATQSLRGLRHSGAQHWRGDRSVGQYGKSAMDSMVSFKNFGPAFQGLLGHQKIMSESEMETFANFMLNVQYPPNPIRPIDNSLTTSQKRGFDFYFGDRPVDGFKIVLFGIQIVPSHNCNGCHTIDATQGKYGTSGKQSFEGGSQIVKIPQLRNMYQKVGRFGLPSTSGAPTGEQMRGFGFVHDGSVDTLFHFFFASVFTPTANSGFPVDNPDQMRADVTEYMYAVDSDLAPVVGQQVTLSAANASAAAPRVDLLVQRAQARFVSKELGGEVKECELVAHVAEAGARRGYLYNLGSGQFVANDGTARSDASLRALAQTQGQEVTYLCAPPGSGQRIAYRSE
jgi:DNA-binding beta-propeller fold protein YncE